ncbi:MAG: indolepyruvate ferredoxin oxidoreductase family protein [Siculibacillus sp.]
MAAVEGGRNAKYTAREGRVFLSGNQALVRLPLEQIRRDRAAGLHTGGFVSGYRGSPLGHLDQDLWSASDLLDAAEIRFRPGVNEDMAATSIWGSQQIGFFGPKVDGVIGLWYSKGPGVDRSGDALRHANLWGTAPHGGVVLAVGDDPMARSSSTQQQSEHTLASFCIPVFHAADVQDIYDFGLIGWQLSRHAGVWTAVKAVSDVFESWYSIDLDPARNTMRLPEGPTGRDLDVHTRWPDRSVDQDERMLTRRLPAVRAFARANRLDRVTHAAPKRRLGIVTTGKSWLDLREALKNLGIDDAQRADIGLEIFKVAMVWPLEPTAIRDFAAGLDEVLIVEECRPILEPQIKDALYDLPEARRPHLLGKRDRDGREWFPSHGELDPDVIARVLADWLRPVHATDAMRGWIDFLDRTRAALAEPRSDVIRTPYFCSGCPHNTSTRVPEGSKQLAGIGCHWLVTLMERDAVTYPQMGGEGATWIGAAPFVTTPHVFVNLGDGTYYHSGSMAIRASIAAGANITYKILFNDAVAMTGGQPVDGPIGVARITHEMRGEGVHDIVVVSADPSRHSLADFAPGTRLHHRDDLAEVQKRLREVKGVSVLIYEQTCATELRRRRGRKRAVDPARRVFVNDRVCEGCGDCSVQSNCLSVQPLETEWGRKREIDQSACNKDFSCLKGFCPSFVTVEGGELARAATRRLDPGLFADLPAPAIAPTRTPLGILVAGIGGTGVVTISNLIGAAAQAEGKFTQALDLTGMAQKFGAVYCHLKIADRIEDLCATRLSTGRADVLIGADVVTAGSAEALSRLRPGSTRAVINVHETVTGAFTRDVDFHIPGDAFRRTIERFTGPDLAHFHDTTDLSDRLTGNTIGANIMLLGFACQMGWLPVSVAALEAAIEANGVAVPYNLGVFRLGRLAAVDPTRVRNLAAENDRPREDLRRSRTLDEVIERRVADLTAYQDAAWAERYAETVARVRAAEAVRRPGSTVLTETVARALHRLMTYKDEYEVARLWTDGAFLDTVSARFTGAPRLVFHMAPPLLGGVGPDGRPRKRAFGPWMIRAMALLARFKRLRGTPFDPFGLTEERREERALIADYEATIERIVAELRPDNHDAAVRLAAVPDAVRGYGPVKRAAIAAVRARHEAALADFLLAGSKTGG